MYFKFYFNDVIYMQNHVKISTTYVFTDNRR